MTSDAVRGCSERPDSSRWQPVSPEERALAGGVSGLLYLMGGLTLASFRFLPGISHAHGADLLAVAGASVAWGLCSLLAVDWDAAPASLIHLSMAGGITMIAIAVASSGGAVSPAWVYLFFPAVFAAYFYDRALALLYLLACALAQALPLLYDSRASGGVFLAQLLIAAAAYLVLGGAIITGRRLMRALRAHAEGLAAEQGALRRVATAVVSGRPPDEIYELVSHELAVLLQAGAAGVIRFDDAANATVMGSWAVDGGGRYEAGTHVPIRPGSDVARARESLVPVRIDAHVTDSPVDRLGYRSSLVAPIQVDGRPWGALAVTAAKPAWFDVGHEDRLMAFGDLLATAIASIEDRVKLASQASTDPLTGLANHRTLQERLAAEVARSMRHDGLVSVAVLDVDHFKQVNDSVGHEAGDATLVRVARCLRKLCRAEDTLGRVGGDEFAWVMPETGREQALVAVERARRVIASTSGPAQPVSVSAGVCDTTQTSDSAELIRFADGALYWSKAHGRDQSWVYDPDVVAELSAQERAERLQRSHALVGLRALARAIDARDPATREHSERVAELVGKLARTAGWDPQPAGLLTEAALVHDVGKLGIPDAVLRKTEPLTDADRLQITEHAELSARIVEDVLAPEQVDWIRTHHERPDGQGYPDGLIEAEIPEGAALLSVADAFDVMTVSRPYAVPKSIEEAMAECVKLVGAQFTAEAVAALTELYEAGELSGKRGRPSSGISSHSAA